MIRLQSVEMGRFRGIREGRITDLKDVNVLVGRNNCGKTTTVEAIARATGGNDIIGRDVSMACSLVRNEKEEIPEGIAYRLDWTESPHVELQIVLEDGQQIRRRAVFTQTAVKRLFGIKTPLVPPASTQFDRFVKNQTIYTSADAWNVQIERALWERLVKLRRDRLAIQSINTIFGLEIEAFNMLNNGQLLTLFTDHSLPLDYHGDGLRAAFRCLLLLSGLEGTLMVIEEPECRQHPASLRRLAEAICQQAHDQQVQVILTTHSLECVRAFMQAAKKVGSEGAAFHLNLKGGKFESRRLDDKTVESLDATGVDVRSLDLFV
jgi:uncharacterized protein